MNEFLECLDFIFYKPIPACYQREFLYLPFHFNLITVFQWICYLEDSYLKNLGSSLLDSCTNINTDIEFKENIVGMDTAPR